MSRLEVHHSIIYKFTSSYNFAAPLGLLTSVSTHIRAHTGYARNLKNKPNSIHENLNEALTIPYSERLRVGYWSNECKLLSPIWEV